MKSLLAAFLLFPFALFSDPPSSVESYIPWFTGPFLAPTAINPLVGHPSIQPSLTCTKNYGRYDNNWHLQHHPTFFSINPLVDFQMAFTENTGIEVLVSYVYNFKEDKSSHAFQDTNILFGYQVLRDDKSSWKPDFRVLLQLTLPTGRYQKLKENIDLTGQGAYFLGPNLAFQKMFSLFNHSFLLHWNFGYFFPFSTQIKGVNAYGGGPDTKGKITPGQSFSIFLSGEYALNKKWALAFDSGLFHQAKSSSFKGQSETPVGLPSTLQISFAPEVEYTFTAQAAFLLGGWFSVAGKNASAFMAGFISFFYTF